MSAPDPCAFDSCKAPATQTVVSIVGSERLCDGHARIVRQIEAERAQAESELDQ